MAVNLNQRRRLAEELLMCGLCDDGYIECPGAHLHHNGSGRRDCRVVLDGVPTIYCFHDSCSAIVEVCNKELRAKIAKAEAGSEKKDFSIYGKISPKPRLETRPKRPAFDVEKLSALASKCSVPVSREWLAERSPVQFPGVTGDQGIATSMAFLSALYEPKERVLVFVSHYSQGDFLFSPSRGSYRLGAEPGVQAVESPLPAGGPAGVWFLVQPVSGKWEPNHNNKGKGGVPKYGRRHGACVTDWRYLVLESDEAEESLWLAALVQMALPIVAIYTSGGRSVHALVRVDCRSKAEFDLIRDKMVQILCPLGADAGAMTGVRLSRLPGALRHGSKGKDGKLKSYEKGELQRLLYLNPQAQMTSILNTVRK